jgi:thioredoxin-like negative regulator of GroEL
MDLLKFGSFVRAKSAAAVHFDAEWDAANRAITRRQMQEAEVLLRERVNFCEVDCDKSPDLAKSIPILNVPSVAYYAQGKLMVVIVGTTQDAHVRLERILSGEFIGHDDSLGEL